MTTLNLIDMKKFLLKLSVIQVTSNEERRKSGVKHLGKGYNTALRLNPLNPLSYPFFLLLTFATLLMFGFVGLCDKFTNPFKWH